MFMRFRDGGIGHLGTCYLNTRLGADNHDLGGKQQDEPMFTGMQVDRDPYLDEEPEDGTEDDQGTNKEFTSRGESRNKDDKEDEDEDEGGDEDTDSECEALRNTDDDSEQDLDIEDNGILDAKGFAELWIDV